MEKDEAAKQLEGTRQEAGRGAATKQWLRRSGASGAMQLEAEGAGGFGRDVCVSSSTAKKTKMLWATLELVGVDFGGEAGVGSGRVRLWSWDNKRLVDRGLKGSGGGYGRAV
jgi:hypothetical protein